MTAVPEPGWHRDPTGRNAQRYWSGQWTDFVAGPGGGAAASDPLSPGEQFPPPGQAAAAPAQTVGWPAASAAATPSPVAASSAAPSAVVTSSPAADPGFPLAPPPSPPRPTSPADWYTDPAGRHQCRYWDGSTWTSHVSDDGQPAQDTLEPAYQAAAPVPLAWATPSSVQPQPTYSDPGMLAATSPAATTLVGPSATTAPATNPLTTGWDVSRWLQLGALIAMAIGVVTAWATGSTSFASASVSGTSTNDGKVFAVVLAVVAVIVVVSELRGGTWWIFVTGGGAALTAFAIYEVFHISSKGSGFASFNVSVSPGFGLYLDLVGAVVLTAAGATIPRLRLSRR